VSRTGEFEELRPLLFAIAYRILGSVAEAEDAVQDTWLRWQSSPVQPASAKAFLSAVVTRISIDVLRSARVRREEYAGPWFPEPLLTDRWRQPVIATPCLTWGGAPASGKPVRRPGPHGVIPGLAGGTLAPPRSEAALGLAHFACARR
jgi:hypothetical protein